MSSRYECPSCGVRTVLVNNGGVYRDMICDDCNIEMDYHDSVNTEWITERDEYHNEYHWEIVE